MNKITQNLSAPQAEPATGHQIDVKRQTVLVLQGGGALGAYQAGVYQALVEGGIEPDWVIGTSIGAINAALIAGNKPGDRLPRLQEFWDSVSRSSPFDEFFRMMVPSNIFANMGTVMRGIPGFFEPNPSAMFGVNREVGVEKASYYTTDPLKRTLNNLVDFDYLNGRHTRLTV
ncbi:MAG: patatin-like phospholipase family protein, partial [Mesorhizobium sp.]|uniref:patatin-like phospholipase family protein n=1 Tax=Mesorhizobium sp. TaxID=1871066 RepID=UPI0012281C1E